MAVLSGTRTLISYRALALGGDAIAVGVIAAAFSVLPLFIALHVGRSIDRGKGVVVLRLGGFVALLAVALTAASADLTTLAFASATLGLGQILSTVATQGLIPLWSDPADYDRRFGNLTLAVSFGQFLGFPIAGAIAMWTTSPGSSSVATTPAIAAMGLIAALAIPVCFMFRSQSAPAISRKDHASSQQSALALLRTPGMKPAIYSSLAVLTSIDMLAAYLPLLGQEIGLSVAVVTTLLTLRTGASILSRATLTTIVRVARRRTLLVSATLCSAIPMMLIAFIPFPIALGILIFVMGFFFGIGQPLSMSWVTTVADGRNRGAALSVRLAGNRVGQVVVPLGAGALAAVTGPGAIFIFTGFLLFTAAMVTFNATKEMRD
jgi:MFS family permease